MLETYISAPNFYCLYNFYRTFKMLINTLFAAIPLTKTFLCQTKANPYPHIKKFTSEEAHINTPKELFTLIKATASRGGCLLKGSISKPLINESRAGSTDTYASTEWICFDIDGLPGINTFNDFLKLLPERFRETSHVTQASCSSGVNPDKGFSGHMFFLLDLPVPAMELKSWVSKLNLDIPELKTHLVMNRANTTLKWPLDISVNQNDKLIYVAPPILKKGVKDNHKGQRIKYVIKKNDKVELNFSDEDSNVPVRVQQHLNELRKKSGLKVRSSEKYTIINNIAEVVSLPGHQMQITGVREDRGFTYLNINGGDSWGYYHPTEAPSILFNFKGEPNYSLEQLAPHYYAKARIRAAEITNAVETERFVQAEKTGQLYLAFTHSQADCYYRGTYNFDSDSLDIVPTNSVKKLTDFLKQHGQPIPDFVPEWNLEYNFASDEVCNPKTRTLNLFRRTDYMRNPVSVSNVPEHTLFLLNHIFAGDAKCIEHFLNWLAVILQHRCMTGTAWVLHGTQGTGKGILYANVLSKIIGHEFCSRTKLSSFEQDFNAPAEKSLILLVDEAELGDLTKKTKALSNIKQMITDPMITIRKMHQNPYDAINFLNFLFFSNKYDVVGIDIADRRFNVAPRQEIPLADVCDTTKLVQAVESELHEFTGYLLQRKANKFLARTPINTQERTRLQALTQDTQECIAQNLKDGNLQYFIDERPTVPTTNMSLDPRVSALPPYDEVLAHLFDNLEKPIPLPRNYLESLFSNVSNREFNSATAFSKFLGHRGFDVTQLGAMPKLGLKHTQGVRDLVFKADAVCLKMWAEVNETPLRAVK